MLIRFFTSNMPMRQLLGIIFTAFLLWIGFFLGHDTWYFRPHAEPLGAVTANLIINWPYIAAVMGFLVILIQAFWLNNLVHQIGFASKTSYLTAFLFLLFSASLEGNLMPGTAILGNFFALGVLHSLINAYNQEYTLQSVFYAALFAGIGSLFYLPVLGLWLFIPAALIIYRQITYREIIFSFLGLLPVAVATFVFYFWKGQAIEHFSMLLNYLLSWNPELEATVPELLTGGMVVFFLLISTFYVIRRINEQVIQLRRYITVLAWYMIFVVLLSGYARDLFQQLILLAPVTALFLGNMIDNLKKTRIIEISLWIFIILVSVYRLQDVLAKLPGIRFPVFEIL